MCVPKTLCFSGLHVCSGCMSMIRVSETKKRVEWELQVSSPHCGYEMPAGVCVCQLCRIRVVKS